MGELSQGWANRNDLQVVQGYLADLPGASMALGQRLACVQAYIEARNSRLGRPLEAAALEDLRQDCQAAILQAVESFTGESPIAAWAQGFIRFAFLKHFRKQRGERETLRAMQHAFVEPASLDPAPEEATAVTVAMAALGETERRTLSMRILEELPFPEIADRLQEPVTTTKSRYVRLVTRLGPQLQAFWKNEYNEGNQ
ncbi:MAG: sigma-70 family RNA polymerase sigma factor [Planctomycetota bacterium]|nr:sigma-70 family RNA polymerase sigma factor [Planctomycetota bacterium]